MNQEIRDYINSININTKLDTTNVYNNLMALYGFIIYKPSIDFVYKKVDRVPRYKKYQGYHFDLYEYSVYEYSVVKLYTEIFYKILKENTEGITKFIHDDYKVIFKDLYREHKKNNEKASFILNNFFHFIHSIYKTNSIQNTINKYIKEIYNYIDSKYDLFLYDTDSFYLKEEIDIDDFNKEFPYYSLIMNKRHLYIKDEPSSIRYMTFDNTKIVRNKFSNKAEDLTEVYNIIKQRTRDNKLQKLGL